MSNGLEPQVVFTFLRETLQLFDPLQKQLIVSVSDERLNEFVSFIQRLRGFFTPTFPSHLYAGSAPLPGKRERFALEQFYAYGLAEGEDITEIIREAAAFQDFIESVEPLLKPSLPILFIGRELSEEERAQIIESPNYEYLQSYLDPASSFGVDARYAWRQPGGNGRNVFVVDIEGGWNLQHEDLNPGGIGTIVEPRQQPSQDYTDHGTAVMGELLARYDARGVSGICWGARGAVASAMGTQFHEVVIAAANRMSVGDVLVLEAHMPGPKNGFRDDPKQIGFIAVEWFNHIFAAVEYATKRKGIVVVAAAGNGQENLDDPIYDRRFNRNVRDSEAILVGGGGSAYSPTPLTPLWFTNYGSRIDLQAWGDNVTTTGYGDLFKSNANDAYTRRFSGTSSATPIVAGAAACLQGFHKARFNRAMSGPEIRDVFQMTGTPQAGVWNKNIGPMPDLKNAIEAISVYTELAGGFWPHLVDEEPRGKRDGRIMLYPGGGSALHRYLSSQHREELLRYVSCNEEGKVRRVPIYERWNEVTYNLWSPTQPWKRVGPGTWTYQEDYERGDGCT